MMVSSFWPRGRAWWLWLAGATIVFVLVAYWIAQDSQWMVYRDYFVFYMGGHMLVSGQDPYNTSQFVPLVMDYNLQFRGAAQTPVYGIFNYPLPMAVLMIPLGMLTVEAAAVVWLVLLQAALAGAVLMLLDGWNLPQAHRYILPVMLAVVLYRPVLATLYAGQLGLLLLFGLVLAGWLWQRERWFSGGLVLALLILKPTVGLPLAGIGALWALRQRRWRAIAGMLAGSMVLFVIALPFRLDWPFVFLSTGQQMTGGIFGYTPTVWGLAALACREAACTQTLGLGLAIVLTLLGMAWALQTRIQLTPMEMLAGAAPVAVLLPPYLWTYDYVLLLAPLVVMVGWLVRRGVPFLVSATVLLWVDVVALGLLFLALALGYDIWNAMLALAVGAVYVVLAWCGWGGYAAK